MRLDTTRGDDWRDPWTGQSAPFPATGTQHDVTNSTCISQSFLAMETQQYTLDGTVDPSVLQTYQLQYEMQSQLSENNDAATNASGTRSRDSIGVCPSSCYPHLHPNGLSPVYENQSYGAAAEPSGYFDALDPFNFHPENQQTFWLFTTHCQDRTSSMPMVEPAATGNARHVTFSTPSMTAVPTPPAEYKRLRALSERETSRPTQPFPHARLFSLTAMVCSLRPTKFGV